MLNCQRTPAFLKQPSSENSSEYRKKEKKYIKKERPAFQFMDQHSCVHAFPYLFIFGHIILVLMKWFILQYTVYKKCLGYFNPAKIAVRYYRLGKSDAPKDWSLSALKNTRLRC